jgi:RNA polymerase sigma factor (sigma-70 family)
MSSDGEGSITRLVPQVKSGEHAAVEALWERYFERLVRLAHKKLRDRRRASAVEDEEDAALSAFHSFCEGAAQGRFPQLQDRDDLWRLLVVITVRKVLDQAQRQSAAKRGGRLAPAATGFRPDLDDDSLEAIIAQEPTPEMAVIVAEEYSRLRDALDDDTQRQILDLRLEGCTREEIAGRLGLAVRTVTRKLDLIRSAWSRLEQPEKR